MKNLIIVLLMTFFLYEGVSAQGIEEIYTLKEDGLEISIEFVKDEFHNHPSFVFWLEDIDGNYIKTIYVTKAIGTSIFRFGDYSEGEWKPASIRRPASLPYWAHKRAIKAEDGLYMPSIQMPVPDAITSATPSGNFILKAEVNVGNNEKVRLLMEINQTWDWNYFWTNNKFPDDKEYMTSAQPALVYEALIDKSNLDQSIQMSLIGRSHHSGQNGNLYTDLETITTAEKIIKRVIISIY